MRSHLTRIGIVACSLVALVGNTTPPARADTVFGLTYSGLFIVNGGMGYQNVTLPTTSPDVLVGSALEMLAHLNGARHECDLPLPNGFLDDPECLTNSHWVFDHARSVSLSHIVCIEAGANVDKPGKAPAHVGFCTFSSISVPGKQNVVTGHCEMSSGQMQVLHTDPLGQDFLVDVHFKVFQHRVVMSGHWWKVGYDQHGLLLGIGHISHEESFDPNGPSCARKTQEHFLITGTVVGVSDPTL